MVRSVYGEVGRRRDREFIRPAVKETGTWCEREKERSGDGAMGGLQDGAVGRSGDNAMVRLGDCAMVESEYGTMVRW